MRELKASTDRLPIGLILLTQHSRLPQSSLLEQGVGTGVHWPKEQTEQGCCTE